MKSRLVLLVACLCVPVFLAGCKGGGSSLGSFFGESDSVVTSYDGGSVYDGGSGDDGSDPVSGTHTPEPATMLLLGSGLFGYAFLRRKKKK